MRPAAVALLSAGTLAYEILLVRVFSIEYFHHFATMAIGVAMLGAGAGGTLMALGPRLTRERAERWFLWASALTPIALVLGPALVHQVPLDPTQLPSDSKEWVRLALVYALLALPFGVGSIAVVTALSAETDHPGRVYGASFFGSGAGALLALAILWAALPARALALPASVAALGALAAALAAGRASPAVHAAGLAVLLALLAAVRPPWRLDVTPHKGLPQVEAYPGAKRVAERASPVGWVVAVDAPAFHFAPGISLAYRGEFPRQTALFVDGQLAGAISLWTDAARAGSFYDHLPSAAPYALGDPRRVLLIGAADGTEIESALAHGATRVTAVELHPELARLARGSVPGGEGRGENRPVDWVVGDARGYLARASTRFDLIAIGVGGSFGLSGAGAHSLDEDFLHTVEAYESCLARLDDRGVLSVTRWVTVPPRDAVRALLTAGRAMRRVAPGALADGLVVVRSWATTTVLAKPAGFTQAEIESLRSWGLSRGFDLDWLPGLDAPATGFHALGEPYLFRAAQATVAGERAAARYADAYPFDVAPATDARPYPHHFLRASSLAAFFGESRGSWLPFAEWGTVALGATLLQGGFVAAGFMLLPVVLRSRARRSFPRPALVCYFAAIGLAYLAAEIAAIQQLGLLLGHPVYAVAIVLGAMLICSGCGSVYSDRLSPLRASRVGLLVAALLAIYAALLLALAHAAQPAPLGVRAIVAAVALVPPAFLMGIPFPIGLRALAGEDSTHVAWAWAANGFASVVAAPLAALLALETGTRTLFVLAAGAYAISFVVMRLEAGTLPRIPRSGDPAAAARDR